MRRRDFLAGCLIGTAMFEAACLQAETRRASETAPDCRKGTLHEQSVSGL